ncbi:MAG: hypothetical protein HRU18_19805 [Pseudoalteromonas sp.]|uniref:hypothetical protein n=1 Tax=Pseudoalteromonas sp. TaxID=53249 RepID=UPI001D8D7E22|nr:hypothetical protein [Pseudoalteromonas sp.]NRA80453.1 hypothetical protein [Pseudoalteromonas sp.]
MNKWKFLRIALITCVAVSSLFTSLEPKANPAINLSALGVIFVFTILALLFVVGMQVVNPLSAKVWHMPDWNHNPFSFKDPIQFFHLAAYIMLVQGAVVLFRGLFSILRKHSPARYRGWGTNWNQACYASF